MDRGVRNDFRQTSGYSVVPRQASSASLLNQLEVQILGLCLRRTDGETPGGWGSVICVLTSLPGDSDVQENHGILDTRV